MSRRHSSNSNKYYVRKPVSSPLTFQSPQPQLNSSSSAAAAAAAAANNNYGDIVALIALHHRRWAVDLRPSSRQPQQQQQQSAGLPQPPGYSESQAPVGRAGDADGADLISKRGWDIALGPARQLPMNMFIMWMAGSSVSIFPIMMVVMMFLSPVRALFSLRSTYATIQGHQAFFQKFVYLLGNVAALALAVYKCHGMGLLPTYESDWLSFVEVPRRQELSGGGALL